MRILPCGCMHEMGLTGELVKSVFSKSRSVGAHDNNARKNGVDRRRWSSVRSYLCGDEFNSVLAEEDSASVRNSDATITCSVRSYSCGDEFNSVLAGEDSTFVKCSEATVTQPVREEMMEEVQIQSEEREEQISQEKQKSPTKLLSKEDAAIVIQLAFRGFLAKRRDEGTKQISKKGSVQGMESPSRESMGTSIEVQTGNSVEALTESVSIQHRLQQNARTQVSKLKEDWDDSTVSSNTSKMRIQNRMEAITRRERALAYAFSQQLRICSKKKLAKSDTAELNMGWSWLERWMATRQMECHLVEDSMSKCLNPINSGRRSMVNKRYFNVAEEEKESCGSNEVPVRIDNSTVTDPTLNDGYRPVKNRLKATRSMSRQRKTMPSYQYPKQLTKVSKKDCLREAGKDRKEKYMQPRSTGELSTKMLHPRQYLFH